MATGRITKVRAKTIPAAGSGVGRITKVRAKTAVSTNYVNTVEPYTTVTLPAKTWTQTGGPVVTPSVYVAPGGVNGFTQTFTASDGSVATITVLPHTMFAANLTPLHTP